jgi:hypothetical protein
VTDAKVYSLLERTREPDMLPSRMTRVVLAVLGLCVLAGSALAVDPLLLLKKKKLAVSATKPALRAAVAKSQQYIRPPVVARTKVAPKIGLHAPATSIALPSADPVPIVTGKPTMIALTGDWSVFAATTDNSKTCFSATQPKDTAPRPQDRAPTFVYLTDGGTGRVKHELTFKLGFSSRPVEVTANVDGQDFKLLASGDLAYPPDDKSQQDLLLAMRHGHTMLLRSRLVDGQTAITDSISLLGVDDSMHLADWACLDGSISH